MNIFNYFNRIANLQVIAQIRNEEYNREERNGRNMSIYIIDNENPSQAPNVNLNELPFMRFNFNRIYLTQHEEIRLRYNCKLPIYYLSLHN